MEDLYNVNLVIVKFVELIKKQDVGYFNYSVELFKKDDDFYSKFSLKNI